MKTVIYALIGGFINGMGFISKKTAAKLALKLFTTPMKGFIKKEQLAFLDTAFKEEFNYKHHSIITYRWPGKGKTVLLIHGWESNSARWKNLVLRLKNQNYNIIALDAPAHGNSSGKQFTAVLYAEYINVVAARFNPNIIIAHSVGAMSATFALEKYSYPNMAKLILLGSPSEFKDILVRYTQTLYLNKRVSKALEELIQTKFNKKIDEFSTAKTSHQLRIDGLLFHDKLDTVIPYQDAVTINTHFKNSKLISTEGLGHSLDHKEVYEHIEEFIEI
ncbi:MAG TPA: alpha/beta hydrolase [Flavobacteriaceae bacterium]|nr:alpha/beta hydrolase [Flavobacteriaceae bacterium]